MNCKELLTGINYKFISLPALFLRKIFGSSRIDVQSISGGDISKSYCIKSNDETLFLKVNRSQHAPAMFEAEKVGLDEIKQSNSCPVPHPVKTGTHDGMAYLIQPFIQRKGPSREMWTRFGRDLAKMHSITGPYFGYPSNNFLGSLPQNNNSCSDGHQFLIENRLGSQFEMAFDRGYLNHYDRVGINRIFNKIKELIPQESPSLLHGDFWSGNYIPSDQERIFVIDPAVYWGHREMDLAMSELFGGFHSHFYDAYLESNPLLPGYKKRREIYQLYFLLAHVNLFGHAYTHSVKDIIYRYS